MPDNPLTQKSDAIRDEKKQAARQLDALIGLSDRFGESLSNAFAKNISEGKKFDNVMKDVRRTFTEFALRSAMAPLQMALTRGLQTLMAGLFGNALPVGPNLSGVGQSHTGGLSSLLGSFLGAGLIYLLPIGLRAVLPAVGINVQPSTVEHMQFLIVGSLIIAFLIAEPHGLARLWQTAKQKLRVWPFPY